jgi:uncharacterized protein (TIGR02452 family)
MEKQELIDIWQETISIVQNGRYIVDKEIIIDSSKVPQNNTLFNYMIKKKHSHTGDFKTQVSIINADCLEQAHLLDNPLVLNMASYKTPGGGVKEGSAAQEENLFRRTNLFVSLYWLKSFYPIPTYGGFYSNDITVFRESDYKLMNDPFKISVITIAALKRPELVDNVMNDNDLSIMKKKIQCIFELAYTKKHENLVLSAFGCGAYGNPPEQIAKLFKEVIEQDFSGCFRNIVFAIYDDHNSYREHNPNGNLKPFKEVFNG